MRSKNKYVQNILTIILLITVVLSSFQTPAIASAQAEQGDGIVRDYNAETGKVTMISGEDNEPITVLGAMEAGMTDEQRADMLVQSFAPEFGITDPASDLEIMEQDQPSENRVTTRYQQTYNGVPVIAGELIVNASEQGALSSMNGEVAQGLSLDTNPTVTSSSAVEIARQGMVKWYGGIPANYIHTESVLSIFDEKLLRPSVRPAELVWKIEMVAADQGKPIREFVVVNAKTGNIPMHFNQIDKAWQDAEVSAGINQPPQQEEPTPTPTEIPVTEPPIPTVTPEPIFSATPISPTAQPADSFQPTPTSVNPPTEEPSDLTAQSGPYYVNIATGSNSNSCTSVAAPCKNIQEAINKAAAGDTIYVASGTYTKSTNPNPNVLQIGKSLILSGGWDSTFANQNSVSIIDGADTNNGVLATTGTITVKNFIIQNSISSNSGAIYIVGSIFTLDSSTLKDNVATNNGAAIYLEQGTLSVINSTISSNGFSYTLNGGGIYAKSGNVSITNSTIVDNRAKNGGGISGNTGTYTIKNTILAYNIGTVSAPDCQGTIATATYSIIENISGCAITSASNNQYLDPQLNGLSGIMQVHPLQPSSPAINAGTSAGCPTTDERGISRSLGGTCDIGAYEYVVTGLPDSMEVFSGSNQRAQAHAFFANPLAVLIKDENGLPVSGVTVTFTAPASGASSTFSDTETSTSTAITDDSGIAVSEMLMANDISGVYFVNADVAGITPVNFQLTNTPYLLATINYEDLVVDEARGKIYGSDKNGNKIDVISMTDMAVTSTFVLAAGAAPVGLELSPDGNELAIAQSGLDRVKFVNLIDGTISEMQSALSGTGSNPFDVIYGRPGILYVLSDNRLHVINTTVNPKSEDTNQYVLSISTTVDKFGVISSDKNTLYFASGVPCCGDGMLSSYDVSSGLIKPTLIRNMFLREVDGGERNLRLSLIDDNTLLSSTGVVYNTSILNPKAINNQFLSAVTALPGKDFYVTLYNNINGADALFFHDDQNSYKISSLSTGIIGTPGAMAVTGDGNTLFVSSTGGMVKFTIGSTAPGTTIDLPVSSHHYNDLAIDIPRGRVYGTDPSGWIDVYDMNTTALMGSYLLPSGSNPQGIDLSPDGNELAIAFNGMGKILFMDPETGDQITETSLLGKGSYSTYDVRYGRAGRLYSDGMGIDYLHAIDTATHAWVAKSSIPLQTGAELVLTADKKYIYANQIGSPNQLYEFDVQTDVITQLHRGPHGPVLANKFTIAPDASKVFTSNGQIWDGALVAQVGSLNPSSSSGPIKYIDGIEGVVALKISNAAGDSIGFFSATNYALLHTISFPGETIYEMEVSPNSEKLILNIDNEIRVFAVDPLLPATVAIFSGSHQSTQLQNQFTLPLVAKVENFLGRPLAGIAVTFTAPSDGASGVFVSENTNTAIAITDINGMAISPSFTANNIEGGYLVNATALGAATSANFQLRNGIQVETYSANNGRSLPGQFRCNISTPACTNGSDLHADKAQQFSLGAYTFYLDKHGRNGIDNSGMTIISTVHYAVGYDDAYWSGDQMVFGDASLVPHADDVVAHEYTHAVTQYESNLVYFYQSGAIGESFSDLWGEYYDQTNGLGTDTPGVKWLIGEDTLPNAAGANRNMSNPPQFGDPDKMASSLYKKTDDDSGGIHSNSGVNNKAAFLMVDGGTFNGFTVTGIGWDKTAAIYYEVQTNLLSSGSDYSDLYFAVQQACTTLSLTNYKGITNADCVQVKKALDSVQMNGQPAANFHVDALVCPAGVTTGLPLNLYNDNLEGGTGNWALNNHWSLEDFYATSATHMLYGDDYATNSVSTLQMNNGVSLPTGTSYLYFKHAFGFEYDSDGYYDGGVLEYSIDNDMTWKDAKPLFSAGKNYTGTISPYYDNSLKSRSAFVGDSHGYTSTRYNLTSLAGKNVKFRWVFATDQSYYYLGWFVDDVKIYTCVGSPSVPAYTAPADKALITDYTPLLDWSDATPNIDHYQVQIATENTFATPVYDVNNISVSQYPVPSDLNPNTPYYWRVRSFNALDETKGWTAARTFRTALLPPVIALPASGTPLLTNRPTFDWADVPGATNYTIQASTVPTFASFSINATAATSTYIPTVDLPAQKLIHWRVRSNGTNGPSAWSSVFTLNTANPPSIPVLVAPTENLLISTTLIPTKLDWNKSTLPVGVTLHHYHIQIATDAAFTAIVTETDITGILPTDDFSSYVTPALSPNMKYYWRVNSFNSVGQSSSWSLTRSYRTALLAPTLTLPASGTALLTNRPTFDWADVPGATNYTIQASTVPTFASFSINTTAATSTYTPTIDLPAKKTIHWRVRSNGTNGPSAWSSVFTLTTANPPSIPALVAPTENLLIFTTLTPTKLDWGKSTVPVDVTLDHYHVQVATDAAFSAIVTEADVTGPALTDFSSYDVSTLVPNTKYYWRVSSFNSAGQYSSWSLTRSFRIAMLPPVLTSPSGATGSLNLKPPFDWEDVAGATSYTIQVSKVNTFSTFLVNASAATSAYTPTVNLPAGTPLYWRVRTNGTNGPSSWSPATSFIIQ